MSDDQQPERAEAVVADADENTKELFEPVTLADFAAVDINKLLVDMRRLDRYALVTRLAEAGQEANEVGDDQRRRVLRLLTTLMGMHLRIEPEGDPFGLQWNNGERRTALPFDIDSALAELLAAVAPDILHPTLRARLADVAYEAGVM